MKIFLMALLLTGIISPAKAQTQKDNIMAGGSIANANATFQSGNSIVGVNLNPKLGYFIANNVVVGLGVNLGLTGGGGVTTLNYGVLPFARYFFSPRQMKDANANITSARTRFFAEVDFGFSGSNTFKPNMPNSTINGTSFSAGPGMSYFITPNVGLETLLKIRGISGFGTSSLALQPELSLGFQIYLPTARAKAIYNEEKRNMNK